MIDLYRLVYASKNLVAGVESDTGESVLQILEASRRNNSAVGVTGALLFNKGAFAQVLEGPRSSVEDTFERIQRDVRHGDVTVLQCAPTESRSFPNWSMAFVGHSPRGQALWNTLAAESGFDLTRLDGDVVFEMLHDLVLSEEGVASPVHLQASTSVVNDRPHLSFLIGPEVRTFDPEQVKVELAHLRFQADPESVCQQNPLLSVGNTGSGGPQVETSQQLSHGSSPALAVLQLALAEERQRTTDLRNALDDAHIALADSRDQSRSLYQQLNQCVERAQLMVDTMRREATAAIASETSYPLPASFAA